MTVRRASPARKAGAAAGPRPRRGDPETTRARLVGAAAEQFELHGYSGTDTNRIARAAGYSPGTFYKHFDDKLDVLLASYDEWIAHQWERVATIAADGKNPAEKAERIADQIIAHHRAWPGLRACWRAQVLLEPRVRQAHRASRRRQLDMMRQLGLPDGPENALLLLDVEHIADAIADGELRALGTSDAEARAKLVERIERHLRPAADRSRT